MGKLIFISGGVRSGKSSFAVELAKKSGEKVCFIATALPIDQETEKRIENHKNARPKEWKTIELQNNLDKKIKKEKSGIILIDCLAIYSFYFMDLPEKKIFEHIGKVIAAIKNSKSKIIIISNEVGEGVHPETKLGRDYRDILGKINQIFAKTSDEFYMMFAGIPINIKKLYGQNQRDNFKN